MKLDRRTFTAMAGAFAATAGNWTSSAERSGTMSELKWIGLIYAPSNLGLRPAENGAQQGAWQAPDALMRAGLREALSAQSVWTFERPTYQFDAQPGTRIRNGNSIHSYSVRLADKVLQKIVQGGFPVVIGGDCSVMLGCLYGSRLAGGRGLVHIDGHSDFFHPGNYDTKARLGSAAGMDLALASGRGEKVLTDWPEVGTLAKDEDIIQMGERNAEDPDFSKFYGDVLKTGITMFTIQRILKSGVEKAANEAIARLEARGLDKVWVHVDLDVLDASVMPAVDSPGSPGLDFAQLSLLVDMLCASGRVAGADFCIYDPERDPDRRYAKPLVDCIAKGVAGRQPQT